MGDKKGINWGVCLLQILLGAVFIFSGLAKGIDPMGTAIKIGEYATAFGMPIGDGLALVLAIALNLVEALLGVAVMTGTYRRVTAKALLVFMVPMTLLTLYIAIFNPVEECGCFGDAIKISNTATFLKNILFLGMAWVLYRQQGRWCRLLPERYDLFLLSVSGLLLIYFNLYPLRHLPIYDWRPYKVGSDLHELTTAGADEGEYEYLFVYEKGGQEKTFGMEELEQVDSTWHFVRSETIEIRPAQQAPGADFMLLKEDGSNATISLVEGQLNALLYMAPHPKRLSKKELELGLLLQEQTGMPVWLVVGNSKEIAERPEWEGYIERYAEVLFLDPPTALTAIRANPGVIAVREGKIVHKLSGYDLKQKVASGKIKEYLESEDAQKALQARRRMAFSPLLIWAVALLFLSKRFWKQERNQLD